MRPLEQLFRSLPALLEATEHAALHHRPRSESAAPLRAVARELRGFLPLSYLVHRAAVSLADTVGILAWLSRRHGLEILAAAGIDEGLIAAARVEVATLNRTARRYRLTTPSTGV